MKNLIIFLFLFVTFFVQAQNYNNNDHFWIGDKLVNITNDKSSIVIIFRQDKIALNQPQLYKNLPNISEFKISDDQRTVIITYSKEQNKSEIEIIESIGMNIENIEWYSQQSGFWLINTDGTNMRRILPYKLLNPVWSPDGEWIAFVVPIGDERHIFKMKFNGETFDTTTIMQLMIEGRNFLPSWSPDGQWIAYDSNTDSPNGMQFIWKMKSDGSQKTRIAYDPNKGEIRMPSWTIDNNKIAHTRYIGVGAPEIFVMDKNGNNISRLTNNTLDDSCPQDVYEKKITFWSAGCLWIMDSLGTNQKLLSDQLMDYLYSISPIRDKVVYLVNNNSWTYENGTLWILDLITGGKRQLTFNPKPNK